MPLSFNSDSLSTNLKSISPSAIQGKSPKIKVTEITGTINESTSQIKSKVTNAVENFKNIKTGALPEIQIPDLDAIAYTDQMSSEVKSSLVSLGDMRDRLNAERLEQDLNLNTQLNSITASKISTSELATLQGNMFEDVKLNVKDITNNQLRGFNTDPSNQLKFVDEVTADVVKKTKAKAEQGVSNSEKVAFQTKSINVLDELVDKKNTFVNNIIL